MRAILRAKDRETAEKLRELFISGGIAAEVSEADDGFDVLVEDSRAEDAVRIAESLRHGGTGAAGKNAWADGSADAPDDERLVERIRAAASELMRDIISSFRPVTYTVLAFIIISFILELNVPGYLQSMGYPALRRGETLEVWRLVSPAFCHLGTLHLISNAMCWCILAPFIEKNRPVWVILLLILGGSAFSNTAQYYIDSAAGYGLSGVIFALSGYLFLLRFHSPEMKRAIPYVVADGIFFLGLIWIALGYTGVLDFIAGPVGNTAHLSGLIFGLLCGIPEILTRKRGEQAAEETEE